MSTAVLFTIIGLLFCPLAAGAAFLIAYQEYSHHFVDKKQTFKMALKMALLTLVVFVILIVVIGLALSKML